MIKRPILTLCLVFVLANLSGQNSIGGERIAAVTDSAFSLTYERYKAAVERADTIAIILENRKLGEYHFKFGLFDRALDHYAASLKSAERIGDLLSAAETKAEMGHLYHYLGDHDMSYRLLTEALALARSVGDSATCAAVYGNLGHYHEKRGNYSKALNYQQRALGIYLQAADSIKIAFILENQGSIFEDMEDFANARLHFRKALGYLGNHSENYHYAHLYNNLGDVERKTGNLRAALTNTRKALALSNDVHSLYQRKSALRDLSKTYKLLGNSDSALYYSDAAYACLDSVYSFEVARQTAYNKIVYHTELQEAALSAKNFEIEALEVQRALGLRLQYTFAGAFLLVLAGGVWIISLQRKQMKNNRIIFRQKESIFKAEEDLSKERLQNAALEESKLRMELENNKLREKQLNRELELRSNEITAHTLHIIRKNKVLKEVREKLDSGNDGIVQVSTLKKTLDSHARNEKGWEEFMRTFEKVHSGFYSQLIQMAPGLTPSDIRLCCMLRLNLPSKEIAKILGISNDSLRIARYRLRRKLNLSEKENLVGFIMQI